MLNFLTYLYPNSFVSKTNFFAKKRIYSLGRYFIRKITNGLLPIIYKIENILNLKKIESSEKIKEGLIVSLTSFPARIQNVHLVIESILRQTVLPERVILWLSKKQFKSLDEVPKKLLLLTGRGLEIKLCDGEDLRSYKKFYYTVKKYPYADIIIIDDDVFYPSDLIENLLQYQQRYPNTVVFNRGYQVSIKNKKVQNYNSWKLLDKQTGPANDIMPTGMGAVLYPNGILPEEALRKDIFMSFCKYADDIWLYSMVLYNGGKLIKTKDQRLFIPVLNLNNKTLTSMNKHENMNDIQLAELNKYYKEVRGINLFEVLE